MSLKPPPYRKPTAHFIGVGGIGISALARWFLAQNWSVSGSDLTDSPILTKLKKEGVKVKIGHKKANLPINGPEMVVYSPAIPQTNSEIVEAKKRGLKPLSYPETLGCLTKVYKTIAISGSHGKSTTTALASLVLINAGIDPNVVVGTNLKEFGNKNFRQGKSKLLLIEADEWKASFLNYFPDILIVTNIDKEHLDFYRDLSAVKKTFLKYFQNVKPGGVLILNQDDKNLRSLHSPISRLAKAKPLKVIWYSSTGQKSKSENRELRKILKIPGNHNLSNATAVLTLAKVLKIRKSTALQALSSYTGAWRRMEYKGDLKITRFKLKASVYDDYAHHPTEIRATLQAFKEKFPKRELICVYQPHQAKRLKALFKEFVTAFEHVDMLILAPAYEVPGRDKINSSFTSKKLLSALKKNYPQKEICYLPALKNIKPAIIAMLENKTRPLSPVIIMMGAGDIVNYTHLVLGK